MVRVLAIALLAFAALFVVTRNLPEPEPVAEVEATLQAERAAPGRTDEPIIPDGTHVMILGAAQDGGVPHLGCTQDFCDLVRQDPSRIIRVASLGLIVPGDNAPAKVFLIDATPDMRSQIAFARGRAARLQTPGGLPVGGILLTHAHIGHYTGLMYLGKESMAAHGVPVYASARMGAFLSDNGPWRRLVSGGNINLRLLVPGERFQLAPDLGVEPLQVAHRDEDSDTLGFVFTGPHKKLLYIPDIDSWDRWDQDINALVASVDVAILDGTFFSLAELPGRSLDEIPHPLVGQTMDRLQVLVEGGHRVIFTHMNHTNPALQSDSLQRREIEDRGFEVAVEGMRIDL